MTETLIERLRKSAAIRRRRNEPDRISDILEEAADALERAGHELNHSKACAQGLQAALEIAQRALAVTGVKQSEDPD